MFRSLLLTAVLLLMAGCTPGPQKSPTPPAETPGPTPAGAVPTPVPSDRLAYLAEACGDVWTEPRGDNAFSATVVPSDAESAGMTVRLTVSVDVGGSHARHTASLRAFQGYVTDEAGTVVGLVTGLDAPDDPAGDVAVTLGACPADDAAPDAPLPDGSYQLRAYGPITPVDHVHVQQEYWVAEPLALTVAGGDVSLG